MRAAFNNAALVKHHDRIRVADSGQTVCYYKYSAPLHEVIHTLLDKRLCAGIDRGCSLVQNHNGRVCNGGAGNGNQLPLPLTE